MKKILHISLMIVFVAAVAVLMGFIVYEHNRETINAVKVNIDKSENSGFLNKKIVEDIIMSADSIKTKEIRSLRMRQLEDLIGNNPYVQQVDVYLGINNDLIVNVEERRALLRIYPKNGSGFYIDEHGVLFPACSYYSPRALVANGYINLPEVIYFKNVADSMYANTPIPGLYELAKKITANPFLNSLVSQIYLNSKGQYDLIPELGTATIKLGYLDDLDIKLRNLEAFYKKKLPRIGWDKYKTINLKYKNQIVCNKK